MLLCAGFLWLQRAGATLRCGAWASHCGGFSSCRAWALGVQASVVVAHGLSSCGAQASLLHGMWDLPWPGLEPVSSALAGGFLTTAPPGKPYDEFLRNFPTIFRSGYATSHSHPQYVSDSVSLHPGHPLVLLLYFCFNFSHSDRRDFIVAIIYISLMANDIEYLFICLFSIFVSSSVKCLFMCFAHFLIELLAFLLLSFEIYIYIFFYPHEV